MCAFAAHLTKISPGIIVTFLTTFGFLERAKTELSRSFEPGEEAYAERVRFIALEKVEMAVRSDALDEAVTATLRKLVAEEEIDCAMTGKRFPPITKPRGVILDLIARKPIEDLRAVPDLKIYLFYPMQLCSLFHLCGPEHLGGKGGLRLKSEEEAARTGRPVREVREEMWCNRTGQVVRVPGLPPMHDYEYFPQVESRPHPTEPECLSVAYETLTLPDAILVFSTESYEAEAVAAVREWYGDMKKSAYVVGMILPGGSHASSTEKVQSAEAAQIEAFLNDTLKTSGKESLLYISFGSVYWPITAPEKLWAFLDVVMERDIPFILSHASPWAQVPDTVKEKVQAYGKGLLSPWTPQQVILNHPATGWFLAHGGQNGIQEAIAAGVPQILWPFSTDQPPNAVHLSENLGIAYELMEVRVGYGLKPIYRTGKRPVGTTDAVKEEAREVLSKAFGEDGSRKRARVLELRKAIRAEHEQGGHARRDLQAFIDSL
ncbi:glycosyltransferase family 1 protein [Polyporus arcularius HHB13444]|uniref:Glycosyltransferase family 1 protein n=1 Tax=Polyporus arcularius HHB13444 TaxID=1314778 RepID=A0A5C3P5U8_9APHY|nr:glycosyltransferase family 1 protein [Polyporus arcularius HHB13444]